MRRLFLSVIATVILMCPCPVFGGDDPKALAKPPSAQELPELLKMLGSANFNQRDAATKRLELMREAELELFRKLDFGTDAEVKRRAEVIIGRIDSRLNSERYDKVFADWQKRQHWFEAVAFYAEGKYKVPRDSYTALAKFGGGGGFGGGAFGGQKQNEPNKALPAEDLEGDVSFSLLLDLAKGRHRLSTRSQVFSSAQGKLNSRDGESAFDGAAVPGKTSIGAFQMPLYPVFFGLGRIHTFKDRILPGQIRKQPPRDELYLHGKGKHEGWNCLIMRTKGSASKIGDEIITSYEEYWVDPERESAIVRYVLVQMDSTDAEFNIHHQVSHGHWLPASWRFTAYHHGKTLYFEDMNVKRVVPNPKLTDADFSLATKAGMP